jgi:hypothetical protein
MRIKRTTVGLLAMAIAGLALPAAATAEYLVPPGNSAATQYTEALPTSGGNRDAERQDKKQARTPSEVLGPRDARQLEDQGETGRETAEFVAETAPGGGTTPQQDTTGSGEGSGGPEADGNGTAEEDGTAGAGAGNDGEGPSGSSGIGEVAAQATGSPSGQLGVLLPLAIVGAAAWALLFALRQRNRPAA